MVQPKLMLPEWLIGEPPDKGPRTFLIHTCEPRFIAEVFNGDDADGLLDSFSYALSNGQSLARFVWMDKPGWSENPPDERLLKLLESADRAELEKWPTT